MLCISFVPLQYYQFQSMVSVWSYDDTVSDFCIPVPNIEQCVLYCFDVCPIVIRVSIVPSVSLQYYIDSFDRLCLVLPTSCRVAFWWCCIVLYFWCCIVLSVYRFRISTNMYYTVSIVVQFELRIPLILFVSLLEYWFRSLILRITDLWSI